MASFSDTIRDIIGAPGKTASVLQTASRAYGVEKAVSRALSDPEKGPSKALLRRTLTEALDKVNTGYPTKTASTPGQDLRSPFMGGAKMPTSDSKSFANKNLDMSKSKAEVGPAPLMSKLKPKGPKVQDIAPKASSSTAGSLPKIGYVMHNDPLILYMRKEAAAKAAMLLEDNKDNEPRDEHWPDELTTQDPTNSEFAEDKGPSDLQDYLGKKFDTTKGRRQKYFNKDHEAAAGLVNKVLKK